MNRGLASAIIVTCAVAGCGEEKIDGFCVNSADQWKNFLSKYQYTEITSAAIKHERAVALYLSSLPPQDFMVAVHVPSQDLWCVQYTDSDMSEVVNWPLKRYDPAIADEQDG